MELVPDAGAISDDMLHAALAFVDEFYAHSDDERRAVDAQPVATSVTSHDELPMPSTGNDQQLQNVSTKKRQPPSVTRPRRASMREDLVSLRDLVHTLTSKRNALAQCKSGRYATKASASAPRLEGTEQINSASLWREVARRQGELRRIAESRNRSLRRMLSDQLAVATRLEKTLTKNSLKTANELFVPRQATIVHWKSPQDANSNGLDHRFTIVDELQANLSVMRTQVIDVFTDPRFPSSSTTDPYRVVKIRNEVSTDKAVEILDARLIPFDLDATAEAQWQNSLNRSGIYNHSSFKLPHSEDLVFRSFEGDIDFPLTSLHCSVKVLTQRVVKPDEVLFMWSMIMIPVSMSNCDSVPMGGVRVRSQGWHLLRPAAEKTTSGQHITSSKFYQVAYPETINVGDSRACKHDMGVLSNFVINTIQFQIDFRFQCLENRLLIGESALG